MVYSFELGVAVEVVDIDQQAQLVLELDGHVMRCVRDQNGNHVIQKCIECISEDRIQFIISSFFGQVVALSTHPYGCRVIQRVLEHCTDERTQSIMMEEILQSACTLAQDQYGNYVMQHMHICMATLKKCSCTRNSVQEHVLEHGKPHERAAVIKKLAGQIVQMSQQKFASNVIEKCLQFGGPSERQILISEMLGSTEENEPLQIQTPVMNPITIQFHSRSLTKHAFAGSAICSKGQSHLQAWSPSRISKTSRGSTASKNTLTIVSHGMALALSNMVPMDKEPLQNLMSGRLKFLKHIPPQGPMDALRNAKIIADYRNKQPSSPDLRVIHYHNLSHGLIYSLIIDGYWAKVYRLFVHPCLSPTAQGRISFVWLKETSNKLASPNFGVVPLGPKRTSPSAFRMASIGLCVVLTMIDPSL
eukprot:Gb_30040 [translate_table: standard]